MAIAALLRPTKILLRFGEWPFVGWKHPRNGTTVRPAWGALPPWMRNKTARQSEWNGCGREFRTPGLTSLLLERSIKECKSNGDVELGPQGRDHSWCHPGTGDVNRERRGAVVWLLGLRRLRRRRHCRSRDRSSLCPAGLLRAAARLRGAASGCPGGRGAGAGGRLSGLPGPA